VTHSVTKLGLISCAPPPPPVPHSRFVVQHEPLCLQESSPTLTLISSKVRKTQCDISARARRCVPRALFAKHCENLFIIGWIAGCFYGCVYFVHHCISLFSQTYLNGISLCCINTEGTESKIRKQSSKLISKLKWQKYEICLLINVMEYFSTSRQIVALHLHTGLQQDKIHVTEYRQVWKLWLLEAWTVRSR
jgi:hypothetical protein